MTNDDIGNGTRPKKTLRMTFHGRIIDQLGSQTYQSFTASLAELVANAWDADALEVNIYLPKEGDINSEIIVEDNGIGMMFEECQEKYLNIGWNKRGDNPDAVTESGRPILGRKGIGKFAGFGVAKIIEVETVSKATGEKTSFTMNLDDITGETYMEKGGQLDAKYIGPDEKLKGMHGTKITLKSLTINRAISKQFPKSMARRFILAQLATGFRIKVDGKDIPSGEDSTKVEYKFPQDYNKEEINAKKITIKDGWGEESLSNGKLIKWRIVFFKDTIEEEELQGVAIFAKGKLAQKAFFFNISGGMGGQAGQVYMSGQVQADYVDSLPIDPLSAERQRINWDYPDTAPLLNWGQEKIKELLNKWAKKRGEKRKKELEDMMLPFSERLEALPSTEAGIVKKVLIKLGTIPTIKDNQFAELGQAFLTAWEGGRLKDIMEKISSKDEIVAKDLLDILLEAEVISALNVAEAIKTKLLAVAKLKEMIGNKSLENAARDHLAANPWIIAAKWDTFKKETGLKNLLEKSAKNSKFDEYKGRIDLTLTSGSQLLVLELMRPGLNLDWDHINRFERYIIMIQKNIEANTGSTLKPPVYGYLIADGIDNKSDVMEKIEKLSLDNKWVKDWDTLFREAKASWTDYLNILVSRGDKDDRLAALLDD